MISSTGNSSSTKSRNSSSRPASASSDSPNTPSIRERQYPRRPMVSPRTISNYLEDEKAMPSMSISTNYLNTIKSIETCNLMQNSTTHSTPQNNIQLQSLTPQAPRFPGLVGSNWQNLLPCTNSLPASFSRSSRCPAALQASFLQPRIIPGM